MSNLVYLNQARKMLTDDYKNQHTTEYNSWLTGHKNSWMRPHTIVPFPPFVIGAPFTPFKPSVTVPTEDEIVAKALELYNKSNPPASMVVPVAPKIEALPEEIETVPEIEILPATISEETETVPETVPEEIKTGVQPDNEQVVEEPQTKTPVISYTDAIYKIYEVMKKDGSVLSGDSLDISPKPVSIDEALNVIPQPSEELSKISKPGKILPTVLGKLQSMTSMWSTKGDGDV